MSTTECLFSRDDAFDMDDKLTVVLRHMVLVLCFWESFVVCWCFGSQKELPHVGTGDCCALGRMLILALCRLFVCLLT